VEPRRSFAGIELRSTVFKSEGTGRERKRRSSVPATPGMGEGLGGGRPWMATVVALEARGNLLVEGRGKAVGWGWRRMVWRCSPRRESDQDGLGEEIDGVALFSVENREAGNWSSEEDERRTVQLGELGGGVELHEGLFMGAGRR